MPPLALSSPRPPLDDQDLTDRATSLVNPASGLANDYLNVFNEIVMLIDLLPDMPILADDISRWAPVTYRRYFQRSALAGREGALLSYAQLDPAARTAFNRLTARLGRSARDARAAVLDAVGRAEETAVLAAVCSREAARLRVRLGRVTDLVNGTAGPQTSRKEPLAASI